jgi:15-cis-phytoene synthase
MRGGRELTAAGITSPRLRAGYQLCRRINARHGKTYYLATLLLPPAKRPYVHALYGFARYADDIVDHLDASAERFESWSAEFVADVELGTSSDPVCRAVVDTIRRWDIRHSYFADFLEAMRADLTVTSYPTYDDLAKYMWGSAAVIGLQMLPILERADPEIEWEALEPYAIDLGLAFQYTNFLRDVAEDLHLGRIYLPQDALHAFGIDRGRLQRAARRGQVDEPIRNLMATEIARARDLYRHAAPGIELVHPTSRDCLRTALVLYSRILDEIEDADYNVFGARLSVPVRQRAGVAARGLIRAAVARRYASPGDRAIPT